MAWVLQDLKSGKRENSGELPGFKYTNCTSSGILLVISSSCVTCTCTWCVIMQKSALKCSAVRNSAVLRSLTRGSSEVSDPFLCQRLPKAGVQLQCYAHSAVPFFLDCHGVSVQAICSNKNKLLKYKFETCKSKGWVCVKERKIKAYKQLVLLSKSVLRTNW